MMLLLLFCNNRVVLFSLGALHQTAISLRRRGAGVGLGSVLSSRWLRAKCSEMNEKARRSWRELSDPGYD